MKLYKVEKYRGKWSILDTKTRVYYFIGCGKQYCIEKCRQLNSGE